MSMVLRVLYGDASLYDRAMVRRSLQEEAFHIIEVTTGKDLKKTLVSEEIDVLLVDFNLPGLEGLQVVQDVRAKDPLLPIIVITETKRENLAMEALKQGATDYVLKIPQDLRRLPFRLRMAWEKAQMRRQRMEVLARLQASEERFRAYVTQASDYIFTLDPQGRFTFVNRAMCKALEYTEDELLGRPALDLVAPEERQRAAEVLERIWSGESIDSVVLTVQTKSGKRLIVQIRGRGFYKEGRLIETLQIARDITEQVQAQQALQESEERFRTLAENTSVAIFVYANERFVYVNPATERITGYSAEELLNMRFWEVVHPEFRDVVRQRGLARQREEQVPTRYEFKILRKDGQVRWIDFTAGKITWKGQPAAIGSAVDITPHKEIQARLMASEARYRALVESSPYGIAIHQDGKVVFVNPAGARLIGAKSPEEVLGRSVLDFIHPAYRDIVKERIRRGIQKREPVPLREEKFIRLDGTPIDVEVVGVPILYNDRPAMQVIFHDITERKRAEERLRLQSSALRHAADAIVITDRYGNVLWANPAFTQLTGYTLDEIRGQNMRLLKSGVHPRSFYQNLWETILSGRIWRSEIINRRKDGTLYHAEQVIAPVRNEDGQITHFVSIMRNIEDRKRYERQLEAQARIAAALSENLSLEDLLERILEAAIHAIPAAEKGSVLLREPDGRLCLRAFVGYSDPRLKGFLFPPDKGFAALAARERRPLLIEDVRSSSEFRFDVDIGGVEEVQDIQSAIAAPLLLEEEVVGVLSLDSTLPSAFDEHDLQVLQGIASTAALVISRARLFEETRRRAAQLGALNAILLAASRALGDLDALLTTALDHLLKALNLKKGGIWMPPSSKRRGHAVLREIPPEVGPLSAEYAQKKGISLDRTIVVPDLREDPDFAQADFLLEAGVRAMVVAPLLVEGRRIGGIAVAAEEPYRWHEDEIDLVETVGRQLGLLIERAYFFEDLQEAHRELLKAYDETIEGWAKILEMRDAETEGHTRRVTELTLRLARAMGVPEEELVHIRRGALLHDIGKMAVPDAILLKPGPLTPEEQAIMQRHPELAYEMLGHIEYLRPALDIPRYHHERWDGSGYPYGLKGEEIPLAARIFAVVDVYDALTNDRPYRPAWPKEKALAHIREQAGKAFDPKVVEVFLQLMQDENGEGPKPSPLLSAEPDSDVGPGGDGYGRAVPE